MSKSLTESEVRDRIDDIYIKWHSEEISDSEKKELKSLESKLKNFMAMDRMKTRGYSRYS